MTIDLPASRQFAAWLSAFNSGRQAEMLTYHEANFPYDKASADVAGIDRELGLSQFTGGFEFKRAEESAATGIVAILKERDSDQFARAAMDVDAEPPHHVLKFEIHPIPTPDDLRPCRMEERDAIVALVTEVDRAMQRDWFSGAVTDLLAFANALTMCRLLDPTHTRVLTTGKFAGGDAVQYAYGFEECIEGGIRSVGHPGGGPGSNGELSICDSGYTVVVLANMDRPCAQRLVRFITGRLPVK
jgi:hypothetical protein